MALILVKLWHCWQTRIIRFTFCWLFMISSLMMDIYVSQIWRRGDFQQIHILSDLLETEIESAIWIKATSLLFPPMVNSDLCFSWIFSCCWPETVYWVLTFLFASFYGLSENMSNSHKVRSTKIRTKLLQPNTH